MIMSKRRRNAKKPPRTKQRQASRQAQVSKPVTDHSKIGARSEVISRKPSASENPTQKVSENHAKNQYANKQKRNAIALAAGFLLAMGGLLLDFGGHKLFAILIAFPGLFLIVYGAFLTYRNHKIARYISFVSAIATLCLFGYLLIEAWNQRAWLVLSEGQKRKFTTTLAAQAEPQERIRLGCPVGNEEVCVSS